MLTVEREGIEDGVSVVNIYHHVARKGTSSRFVVLVRILGCFGDFEVERQRAQ